MDKSWLMIPLIAAFIIIPNVFIFKAQAECRERGGTYVKTVLWFDCIEGK